LLTPFGIGLRVLFEKPMHNVVAISPIVVKAIKLIFDDLNVEIEPHGDPRFSSVWLRCPAGTEASLF